MRTEVSCLKTHSAEQGLSEESFKRFSTWQSLIRAVCVLKKAIRNFKRRKKCAKNQDLTNTAEEVVIKITQRQYYSEELSNLKSGLPVPKRSHLISLNPFLDPAGVLRVGGRLQNSNLNSDERHPIILPGKSHVAQLIVRSCHEDNSHQGRLITEGAVRSKGFWIVGAKRLVNSTVYHCVRCRKLRGKEQQQLMANLPTDRVVSEPPFTNIGVDVFGPWDVIARKTRGGQANNKRWAALFICMSTRAVHIEVLETMTSSSFVNALRRLVAVRGKVKTIRSDQGTNFTGAEVTAKSMGITWRFNPPHSSHMGGLWERAIGMSRRILDSMLTDPANLGTLTHEVLVTLMAEVAAILNSRPITTVSGDSEDPMVLSPALLLTHKNFDSSGQEPCGNIDIKDIYRDQWKRVQYLSQLFWTKWKRDYLATLQSRQKWQESARNVAKGDIVLLKDKTLCRGEWPLARVTETVPSEDGKVRKVTVKVFKNGQSRLYERPVTEVVMILEQDQN